MEVAGSGSGGRLRRILDIVPPFYTEEADSEPTAAWEFRVGFRRFLTVSGSGEDARNKGWEGPFWKQRYKKDRAAAAKRQGITGRQRKVGWVRPTYSQSDVARQGLRKKKHAFRGKFVATKGETMGWEPLFSFIRARKYGRDPIPSLFLVLAAAVGAAAPLVAVNKL